jgi:hypothetical protein
MDQEEEKKIVTAKIRRGEERNISVQLWNIIKIT